MGLVMLVQLYTSRIVLANLGVDNYGIYNVVASFIVAFTFIKGPLNSATQRFLNFEIGKGNVSQVNLVFNISLRIYAVLALVLIVLIGFSGEWFINNKMQIPLDRIPAAQWCFYCSLLALAFNIMKTPFSAMVIANEKMSFFAYTSIIEVVFKLLNAFSLEIFDYDKLKIYAINHLIIDAFLCIWFLFYCKRNFIAAKFKNIFDKKLFKEMISFSSWTLFGSIAVMTANQGLNILLNIFYGLAINAAMGIASQVNSATRHFVSNFQTAYKPQIVKYYAQEKHSELAELIYNSAKYSYLLLFAIVCPLIFNIEYVLNLWLKTPPESAGIFCVYMFIYSLLETLSAPMWMSIQASGKIKKYQLCISSAMVMNIILSYIFLSYGAAAVRVLQIKCVLDVLYFIIRFCFLKRIIKFSFVCYFKRVLWKIACVSVISAGVLYFVSYKTENFERLVLSIISFGVVYFTTTYFIAIDKETRKKIILKIRKKIKKE